MVVFFLGNVGLYIIKIQFLCHVKQLFQGMKLHSRQISITEHYRAEHSMIRRTLFYNENLDSFDLQN